MGCKIKKGLTGPRPSPRRRDCWTTLVLAVTVAALTLPSATEADILPSPRWRLPIGVTAAVERNGVVYLGGTFRYVFQPPPADPLFVDRATGAPLSGCASKSGSFTSLGPDAAGGAFMAVESASDTMWDGDGPFAVPSGTTFLRVLPNCRWDRGFLPSGVAGSPLDTGSVVVAAAGGLTSAQLAVYDRVTGQRLVSRTSWPVVFMQLLGMAGPDTVVLMTAENPPQATYSLRHLTLSTMTLSGQVQLPAVSSYRPGIWFVDGRVLVQPDVPGTTYPLYALDAATLQPSSGWTNTTAALTSWPPFVAGGYLFTQGPSGPVRRDSITGSVDPAWQPPPALHWASADGSRILVQGGDGYRSLNPVTGAVEDWTVNAFGGPGPTPLGQAIALGRVQGVNGVRRDSVAAINASTGELLPLNPLTSLASGYVGAMSATATHLYLNIFNPASHVVRVALDTGIVDPTWDLKPFGAVHAMAATDSTLYLGGNFTSLSGLLGGAAIVPVARAGAAAVDLTGLTIAPWNPNVGDQANGIHNNHIKAMALTGDSAYLGGTFTTVGGQPRGGFARVDLSGGALLSPALPLSVQVEGIASDGVNAYLLVLPANPGQQPTLARVTPAGGMTTAAVTLYTGPVFAGGRVYADRERDATTLQPTASPVVTQFAFLGENGVMAKDQTGGVAYYGFAVAAPPGAPQGLTATTGGNSVGLSWLPAAGDALVAADVGAPASYVIRAGSGPGLFNLADVDTGSLATSLATSAPNGTYFVRVHARNTFGLSPASNEVTFTLGPQPCTTLPGAPGTLSATVSGLQVAFTWGSAASATTYVLEAGSATGLSNLVALNVGSGLSFAASAAPGTFFIRVRGSNACGVGPASNEVPITLGTAVPLPGAPQNLTAEVSGRTVTLAWSTPVSGGAPSGYVLEAGSSPGLADIAAAPVSATGFVAPNVPTGRYYVRVRATNAAGSGPPTSDREVVVP